ncbi:ABC-F family ATP-binding cassette domain-containing protein [Pseudemcibacter aquimaris]|uniref:ABC-F family ATP-binding cassette domain-containing protein n=1 Tax=Pseudemcibacter aquimaris TaxID=2857064 RepID=UPI0020132DD0|nr:ATP-binding cassette domain-containing protein [Pseudemcibacter aquimaris]MCC3862013.1 ATP-binding cassette domain-containing protein [Pseudemcibacter aquimaris]WDU58765.1 ATP-binding cassette domain-containing protein [Pseudemcibacter aquimaris]
MAPPLLTLTDMALRYGPDPLFRGVELSIGETDRISLVGRNGAGKSTLMKIIHGSVEFDSGERFVKPGTHVTYLEQDPDLSRYKTAHDYVISGLVHSSEHDHFQADIILAEIGLEGKMETANMSGGEKRRAAIARALISETDILLLDEPTNHLDIATIEWLESKLKSWRGALVLISHDRTFLNNLTNTTFWLDRGLVRRLDKGFAHFEEWSNTILEQETAEKEKLDKLIAKETDWSHKGITARRKRNMGRMRRLWELRHQREQQIAVQGTVKLSTETDKTSGKKVIEAHKVYKSYDDKVILKNFNTKILRGDRVGIIGPNGAGKSTLLKILTGDLDPDQGRVKLGTNLEATYLDQNRTLIKDTDTVWETLSDGSDHIMVRGHSKHIISYIKDFLFDASQAHSPVGSLSGGERNRLLLAKTLAQPTNLLILDEPTNDLDMDTLDLLQDVLSEYNGTLLLVSHDRDFLDRLVTSTIVMEGNGDVIEYPGGYSDYVRQRKNRKDASVKTAAKPKEKKPEQPTEKAPAKKISYKHKFALENLPKEIAKIEKNIKMFEEKISEPDFYNKDPELFNKCSAELEKLTLQLEEKEEELLELEIMMEELE